jgi:hypothetical protein
VKTVTDISTRLEQDLRERQIAVRRTELLLKLEQWGPRYRRSAGDWLRDFGDLVDATAEELTWLGQYVTANGMPPETDLTTDEWFDLRREQGRQANAAASAAFLAGAYDAARDRVDDARAHGALTETEWVRLHEFILTKAAESADRPKRADGTIPTQRAA